MKGIYKITSPSGKIYIGQSTNIKTRFFNYRKSDSCKKQRILYSSFMKYGIDQHLFEVIYQLPDDVTAEILTTYEQFFMDQYREAGLKLMNLKAAGPHGGHSEATKKRLSIAHMGKPKSREAVMKQSASMRGRPSPRKGKTHTEESKQLIREKRALQTNVKGRPIGHIPWNKGLIGAQVAHNKGISPSGEVRAKISKSLQGRKLSPESIRKREATRKANGNHKGWSEEAKKRRAGLYKGRPSPNKGQKMRAESVEKMRQSKIGKRPSAETRKKMSEAHQKRIAKNSLVCLTNPS